MKDTILIDLFSGVGGMHKGLEMSGFEFTKTYFSEIDKHAIAVYKNNFPDAEYIGSVVDVSGHDIRKKHPGARVIISFGWPCQDNSIAGKRKGQSGGARSSLLFQAVRIIQEVQPDYFIAENVKGLYSVNDGVDFIESLRVLSYLYTDNFQYNVEHELLNTSWIIPQNRERTYFIGYPATRGCRQILPIRHSDLKDLQEKARRDIRERVQAGQNGVPRQHKKTCQDDYINGGESESSRYRITNPKGQNVKQKVAGTLTGEGNSGGNHSDMTLVMSENVEVGTWRTHKDGEGFRKVEGENAPTIPARAREDGSGQPVIQYKSLQGNDHASTIRNGGRGSETQKHDWDAVEEFHPVRFQRTEEGKRIRRENQKNGRDYTPFSGDAREIVDADDKNEIGTITRATNKDALLGNRSSIRRLTENECETLQGFPWDWTKYGNYDGVIKEVSSSQRYKQIGNAVTVHIVALVGQKILESESNPKGKR